MQRALPSQQQQAAIYVVHRMVQALKRSTAGRPVVGVGLEVGFENQNTRDSRIVVSALLVLPMLSCVGRC